MSCTIWKVVVLFLVVIVFHVVECSETIPRKIIHHHNPGCNLTQHLCDSMNLMYLRADEKNDTIHYLWDFTGQPSMILAVSSIATELKIDWKKFISGHKENSVTLTETPKYTFGIIITKIWEFDDKNDTASLMDVNSDSITFYPTHLLHWNSPNYTYNSEEELDVTFSSSLFSNKSSSSGWNKTVLIKLNTFGFEGRAKEMPHLLHTLNSTHIDFILDHIHTGSGYNNSRFGLEILAVSSESQNGILTLDVHHTLNDEYSPGVFKLVKVLTPAVENHQQGGYIEWRPVCYTSSERDVTSSTDLKHYPVSSISEPVSVLNDTLLYAYYGKNLIHHMVNGINVTFGIQSDGFYKKTNYSVWTVMIGYGTPPEETFSLLVILVMAIGLGLPAGLILFGSVFIAIRKLRTKKDDLLLGS